MFRQGGAEGNGLGDGVCGFEGLRGVNFVGGDGGADGFRAGAFGGVVVLDEGKGGAGAVEGDEGAVD